MHRPQPSALAAGLDVCRRRLLRDALPTLFQTGSTARGKFVGSLHEHRLKGGLTNATKTAIADDDPCTRLIELYVEDLAGSSLQNSEDLKRVRDALGLASASLADSHLSSLRDFFAATADTEFACHQGVARPRPRRAGFASRMSSLSTAGVICPYSASHPVARWSPRRVNTAAPEAAPVSESPSSMTG